MKGDYAQEKIEKEEQEENNVPSAIINITGNIVGLLREIVTVVAHCRYGRRDCMAVQIIFVPKTANQLHTHNSRYTCIR